MERVYTQNLRARSEGVIATLTLEEWTATIERFEGLCTYCQVIPFTTLDHVIPYALGGGTEAMNCVPACKRCNSRKGAMLTSPITASISLEERLIEIRNILQKNVRPAKEVRPQTWPRPVAIEKAVTTMRFTPQDMQAIATIRERYGCISDTAAVRLALQIVARQEPPPITPQEERPSYPHA